MDRYLMRWPADAGDLSAMHWEIPAHLRQIRDCLSAAWDALTLQCADASVGHFIPEVRGLPGFRELHRENYDVSYHLATALGSASRLLMGDRHPGFLALLASCQKEAAEHQEKAALAYRQMAAAAPDAVRHLLRRLGGMILSTSRQLEAARAMTLSLLGPATVQTLVERTEEATQRQ